MTPSASAPQPAASVPLEMISYVSLAADEPTQDDLEDMLKEARQANQSHQITGSLLYRDGTYVQVFEGPATATDTLYQKILADKRHHNVVTLFRKPTQRHYFRDWSMAFRPLTDDELIEAQDHAQKFQDASVSQADATSEILSWIKALLSEFDPPSSLQSQN